MPFFALALHLYGTEQLEDETSKIFSLFNEKMDGLRANQFQGVLMNDILTIGDLLTVAILMYDIDMVDGNFIGELASRSVQKKENTVRVLRYNNHTCYVSNINAVLQSFCCPNCDTFFQENIQPGAIIQ